MNLGKMIKDEMGTTGALEKLKVENAKLEGTLDFLIVILQKLADEGSELAKAALESLKQ